MPTVPMAPTKISRYVPAAAVSFANRSTSDRFILYHAAPFEPLFWMISRAWRASNVQYSWFTQIPCKIHTETLDSDGVNTDSPDDQVEYITTTEPEHESIATTMRTTVKPTASPVDEYDDSEGSDEESTSKLLGTIYRFHETNQIAWKFRIDDRFLYGMASIYCIEYLHQQFLSA